ncbi:NAD(P)/FAD-dependent oxidoreductase [Streptomyces sp. PanSC9]|uniref:NAD(P)/FAD-dependent oxidoreductase n=1 Tax=Streptomyces sp. PanSC9 TaxID=1520461 RepID=UPI000FB48459|nr:hypothetical protein [Streptomyces sp. PanSC9]ROP44185.1 hypothetical protein EDD94_7970 [Streptomyces sp. PanSC9]
MGHVQLERWYPGIVDEMVAAGARLGSGSEVKFYVDGKLRPPLDDVQMIGATRPFIERYVRQRTLGLPNVRLLPGRAQGLVLRDGRVQGVRCFVGYEETVAEVDADMVVDAMGRSSRLSTWLAGEGWPVPTLQRMRVDLGYATATFRRGPELPDTVIAHSSPGPASNYQPGLCEPGALAAVEDGKWSVVLAGYGTHQPTRNPDDFLARMRHCVTPLQEVAERCTMDGAVDTFHFRESQRRLFTPVSRFPGGLAVVGDAMASVNPVYGQGLTLATLQASCLAAHLRSSLPRVPAWSYFHRAAAVVDAAWQLSTTADLAQPHVTGPYPRGYRLLRWAGDRITEASVRDPQINRAYMRVLHMLQHPRTLASPHLLLRTAQVLMRG